MCIEAGCHRLRVRQPVSRAGLKLAASGIHFLRRPDGSHDRAEYVPLRGNSASGTAARVAHTGLALCGGRIFTPYRPPSIEYTAEPGQKIHLVGNLRARRGVPQGFGPKSNC